MKKEVPFGLDQHQAKNFQGSLMQQQRLLAYAQETLLKTVSIFQLTHERAYQVACPCA
jgi:hypothetical protein